MPASRCLRPGTRSPKRSACHLPHLDQAKWPPRRAAASMAPRRLTNAGASLTPGTGVERPGHLPRVPEGYRGLVWSSVAFQTEKAAETSVSAALNTGLKRVLVVLLPIVVGEHETGRAPAAAGAVAHRGQLGRVSVALHLGIVGEAILPVDQDANVIMGRR